VLLLLVPIQTDESLSPNPEAGVPRKDRIQCEIA